MVVAGLLPGDVPLALPPGLTYLVDIETDGLPDVYTRVHSLVVRDANSGELVASLGGPDGVCPSDAAAVLGEAAALVAHNGISFDFPALERLLGWRPASHQKLIDTLPLVRLVFSNIKETDGELLRANRLPGKLFGSHSLEAWGYRLGVRKGEFGSGEAHHDEKWELWSREMQDYCEGDTLVNLRLLQHVLAQGYSSRAVELELEVAQICAQMELNGFPFDKRGAEKLEGDLSILRAKLEQEIRGKLRGWWRGSPAMASPRSRRAFICDAAGADVNRGTKSRPEWVKGWHWSWTEGVPWTPIEWVELNPGSRDQVAEYLKRLRGWEPKEFTDAGKPKVDETTLGKLEWAEAKLLGRYFLVAKRLGQLADGNQAWLKLAKEHVRARGKMLPAASHWRIHGSINPNGCVTGRATHYRPNMSAVPSVKLREVKDADGKLVEKLVLLGEEGLWGHESRALFTAPRGRVLIGADLSSLELLMKAHYLHRYDSGKYKDFVLNGGDPHVYMQEQAGLATRAQGKTMNYALDYGAGDWLLGNAIDPKATDHKKKQLGKELRAKVMANFQALGRLIGDLKKAKDRRGFIYGLDGRPLYSRSDHSLFNLAMQSAGALVAKAWLRQLRVLFGEHWELHSWSHDEVQFSVEPRHLEWAKVVAVEAARMAGEKLNLKVPVLAEAKHGRNWAETH